MPVWCILFTGQVGGGLEYLPTLHQPFPMTRECDVADVHATKQIECKAKRCTHQDQTTTQHNTTQHNTTQHNTTQHNTTQHNTTQHNTTQHNATQHNTTQYITSQHSTMMRGLSPTIGISWFCQKQATCGHGMAFPFSMTVNIRVSCMCCFRSFSVRFPAQPLVMQAGCLLCRR